MINPSGEVAVLRLLDKKITSLELSEKIGAEFGELLDEGHTRLVISFLHVQMHTSPLLNVLLKLREKLNAKTGALRLCDMNPIIREVYRSIGLDKVFAIYPTEKEALMDF
ncbi:MAG: STAS domain-containing protein [Planctomycetales bacterium]|nr:STAS domain-containing protein [Planctomycetales bacterium]